jgi:hypothetical protein
MASRALSFWISNTIIVEQRDPEEIHARLLGVIFFEILVS